MATVLQIDLNNLDKTTWESFRFEEITNRVAEGVDPNTTTLKKYVGLEHIDADNIHIKRFGTPDDVSGGKLKCYPGDVIFGKRRAYQRKAAIVDFEGICSAHAFVFRANPEVIDPKLFPLFLHSDQFMHRAVDISVGGLSPTINWGDLKHQEFLLPPKAEQARLAELLWAMDDVIEKEKAVLETLEIARKSQMNKIFFLNSTECYNSKTIKLSQVINLSSGKTRPSDISENKDDQYLYPVYGGNGIIGYSKEFLIDFDTIILGRVGEYCGTVHDSFNKVWISDNALYVKEFLTDIDKFYISRFLEYIDLNKQQNKSSYPLITQSKVSENKIPIYPIDLTINLTNKLKSLENTIFTTKTKITYSYSLQKSLINQIF